jgi:DNA-binding CsgD family transcriptional regulator
MDDEADPFHPASLRRLCVPRPGVLEAGHGRIRLRDEAGAPSDSPSVTPREAEVLSLASHGLTYAEIAEQLGMSASTISTHLENIYPSSA